MTNVRRPIHLQLSLNNTRQQHQQQQNSPLHTLASPGSAPVSTTSSYSSSNIGHYGTKSSTNIGDVEPSEILPHLFVGNQEQTNKETVKRLNISYILSLGLLPLISSVGGQTASTTKTTIHSEQTSSANNTKTTTTTTNSKNTESNYINNKELGDNLANDEADDDVEETIVRTTRTPIHACKNIIRETNSSSKTKKDILLHSRKPSEDFKIRIKFPGDVNTSSSTVQNNNSGNPETTDATENQLIEGSVSYGGGSHSNNLDQSKQEPSQALTDSLMPQQQVPANKLLRNRSKSGCKVIRTIHCKCINIADNSEAILTKFFDEAHQFIDEARRKKCNILVHCLAGISRSPTIAISYLMRCNSLRLQDAYNFVKQCRPQIDPNLSFMGQLMVYEKSLERLAGYKSSCSSSAFGVSMGNTTINSSNNVISGGFTSEANNCSIDNNNSSRVLDSSSVNSSNGTNN